MAKRKYFQSHKDFIKAHISEKTNSKIALIFSNYCFNCKSGFILFARIARLADINAPAEVLKKEIYKMEDFFKNSGYARNEVAKLKRVLFGEYPDMQQKIRRIKIEHSYIDEKNLK